MRTSIMDTYKELIAIRKPSSGLPIYFEYVSKYRRVLIVKDQNTWILRVSYKGTAAHIKTWQKTYADQSVCKAWAMVQANNTEILISPMLTIREAIGKVIIDI